MQQYAALYRIRITMHIRSWNKSTHMYIVFETIHKRLIPLMPSYFITTEMKDNPQCMIFNLLLLAPIF